MNRNRKIADKYIANKAVEEMKKLKAERDRKENEQRNKADTK